MYSRDNVDKDKMCALELLLCLRKKLCSTLEVRAVCLVLAFGTPARKLLFTFPHRHVFKRNVSQSQESCHDLDTRIFAHSGRVLDDERCNGLKSDLSS